MTQISRPYLTELVGGKNIDKLLNDYFSKQVLEIFNNPPKDDVNIKKGNALCYFLGAYYSLIENKILHRHIYQRLKNFYLINNLYDNKYVKEMIDEKVKEKVRQLVEDGVNIPSYYPSNYSQEYYPASNPPPPYSPNPNLIGGSKKRKQVHKKKSKKLKNLKNIKNTF